MANNKRIKVYIVGDSTVQTYDKSCSPQAGWGQFISDYFAENVGFINHAMAGRSSKSFINEGRLDSILKVIGQDDYLFIQMGHNDAALDKSERYTEANSEYKKYLKIYIDAARKHGAIPILITPVATLKYKDECFVNEFPEYCTAMKQLSISENVQCIDLMAKSLEYFGGVGYNETYTMFMASTNGTDYAHFTEKGANIIARIISKEIMKMDINFFEYVI